MFRLLTNTAQYVTDTFGLTSSQRHARLFRTVYAAQDAARAMLAINPDLRDIAIHDTDDGFTVCTVWQSTVAR